MKDLRETKLYIRYDVTDQSGTRVDAPAVLLWTASSTLNTTRVRLLPTVVERTTDLQDTLFHEFNRYAAITVSYAACNDKEIYCFTTTRYGETHTLTIWIETKVPDFGYFGGDSLFPPSRR